MRLNLGAGNRVKNPKKWINHDLFKHKDGIEVVWNLNRLPWPWKSSSFEQVEARCVFEHLDIDLVRIMDECWRILKPGGEIYIKVPNAEDYIGVWDDPTHRRPYTVKSFSFFDPSRNKIGLDFYTARKWDLFEWGQAGKRNETGVWSSIYVKMKAVKP